LPQILPPYSYMGFTDFNHCCYPFGSQGLLYVALSLTLKIRLFNHKVYSYYNGLNNQQWQSKTQLYL